MNAANTVITSGVHSVGTSFADVFIKESNFEVATGGDPIFEIPFAKESTGNTGYLQGPASNANEGKTLGKNVWGESKGNVGLSAFYRWAFDQKDKRRNFVNGLWYYGSNDNASAQDSCQLSNSYTVYNNKWSKLWANPGQFTNISAGNTGINFPYMRYTDVLLMYAEAANELNGPTVEAQEALRQVRARAFDDQAAVSTYLTEASASKEAFLKAVLDERKLEFAGENMRWRDLVRNNLYNREVIYSFLRYLSTAMAAYSTTTGFEDDLAEHDNVFYEDGTCYLDALPEQMYFHILPQNTSNWKIDPSQVYGYPYPNTTMDILYVYNPDRRVTTIPGNTQTAIEGATFTYKDFYLWESNTEPTNQCRYSFYGYVRFNDNQKIVVVKDGAEIPLSGKIVPSAEQLPPVRYILPYPNSAIQRSAGAYKNYYGYIN